MALAVAGQNAACDGIAAVAVFSGLHTGDPSTTGANEATGGAPAYARKAAAWSAASAGQRVSSGAQLFDVPAGTYYWISKWSASTAGTYYGATPLGGQTPKPANVIASTDLLTVVGNTYVNDDRLVVFDFSGAGVPTGLVEGTVYFAVAVSSNNFSLALTSGGTAINVTADGACWVQKCIPEQFGGQGQLNVPAGSDVIDCRGA